MDEPSAQLHLEIRESVVRALATRRPILHHLNADTSWLLQVPRPAAAVKYGGRIYYNILIDPWFVGGQSDVARWFSQQWHREESKVKSVQEVEEICRQIELLAGGMRTKSRKGENTAEEASLIDVIAISHEFTDHCHRDTLLEVHPDVPVIAAEVRQTSSTTRQVHSMLINLRFIGCSKAHRLFQPLSHCSHHSHLLARKLRLARPLSRTSSDLAFYLIHRLLQRRALLPLRNLDQFPNPSLPPHDSQEALLPAHHPRRRTLLARRRRIQLRRSRVRYIHPSRRPTRFTRCHRSR